MKRIDSLMAAYILECSQRQVQQWVTEGELTNIGEPRRILLDIDEVSALAAKRRGA